MKTSSSQSYTIVGLFYEVILVVSATILPVLLFSSCAAIATTNMPVSTSYNPESNEMHTYLGSIEAGGGLYLDRTIAMRPVVISKGNILTKPSSAYLGFSTTLGRWEELTSPQCSVTIDGEVIPIGALSAPPEQLRKPLLLDYKNPYFTIVNRGIEVPIDIIEKLAKAREISITLGDESIELAASQYKFFRIMLAKHPGYEVYAE